METGQSKKTNLTPRQERLLVELVKTPDIQAAAKAAEVGRTTVYRWLEQPEFAAELDRCRNQAMNEALCNIKSLSSKAVQVMQELLDSENHSVRRMVCKDVLRHALQLREMEEIEQRLSRIEREMEKLNPGGRS
ncbi:hypothetical protein PDESU_00730 [Pontiella desulfatans]|uniref:Homeodomain phBC6A51-type domain-containing protein n=1 Tax=Pontiella desulfatans TaxID=2750659 RepID=A0A6C2TX46_PONDE|nr:hypothetical protein [Pontiella desulfatans]VGO12179.1 hypothetical protein PDESU_00730 [Pontiella desulfatans]